MVKIAPSLLSADFSILREEIADIERGGADWLHLDIMDGHFVPNITFGPSFIQSLRPHSSLFFDAHLMITHPDQYIEMFAQSGVDLICVHAEAAVHLHRTIQNIKNQGIMAGVALNPATPLNVLEYILSEIDLVLLMSVNPGFGGQTFINIVPKLEQLVGMCHQQKAQPLIEVDGGITKATAPLVIQAGANVLVAGSAVFGKKNRKEAISLLRDTCF